MKKNNHNIVAFIDPASISSGWAIYSNGTLVKSSSFTADKKNAIATRLKKIYNYYYKLMLKYKVNEVHIERLVRNTHIHTHWAVGVIMAACSSAKKVDADISIKSWQTATNWNRLSKKSQTDEQAAILMGRYFYEKNSCNT